MHVARAMLLTGFSTGGRITPIIRTVDTSRGVFAGALLDDDAHLR